MKNKKIIILSIIIAIISLTIIIIKIQYNYTIKNITKNYSKYVITNKNSKLFNKNKKVIGKFSDNIIIELEKINTKDIKNTYYKIKNSDYYIYYKDVKKTNKIKNTEESKYLDLNFNIKTNKKTILYKENKKALTINKSLLFNVEKQDDSYYYINYLNNNFKIKKDNKIQETPKEENIESCEQISVLYYYQIADTCSNYNCITTTNFKEQINKLIENNYYTITLDEYNNFLNNYINLKPKAILIIADNQNEITNNIINEYNISINDQNSSDLKFKTTNTKSTKQSNKEEIERYHIKSYTTIENILKMAAGEEVIEQAPITKEKSEQKIAVLNYHFFYDAKVEGCFESICLDTAKFREQLEYLKNNNFKTLTMKEFKDWMYGEIELPEKSVLLTIDDGALGTGKHNGNKLIPLLEEYKMNATLFLIAGWWDISNYQSPYLTIQSHTFDMHQYGPCGTGQINCATYDEAVDDLKKSIEIIKNTDSFCFPFYNYNNTSLQAVKDVGFSLAFVGGNRKATRSSNKFLIPRYPIHQNITLDEFIRMVN